jgi:hypothetical protein
MGGPKFWRDRAAEARRLADRTLDPRSKFILSKLAEEYEELAEVTGRTAPKKPGQQELSEAHVNAATMHATMIKKKPAMPSVRRARSVLNARRQGQRQRLRGSSQH